jgi:hypothetical protein
VIVLVDEVEGSGWSGKACGLLHDSRGCASRGLKCRLRNGKSNPTPRLLSRHPLLLPLLRIHTVDLPVPEFAMSLVAGPGRGGAISDLPAELQLYAQKHVDYIQSLDTVRRQSPPTARLSY